MSDFSVRLKKAFDDLPREKRVQARIADACGVSKPSVSDWFKGDTKLPASDVMLRLCDYLGVSPYWLVLGKGEKDPSGYITLTETIWPFEKVDHSEFEKLTERQKGNIDMLLAVEIAKISTLVDAKKILPAAKVAGSR